MAMAIQFDTLDYAKKLETAGVPVAQAEAQSKLLADVLGKSVAFPGDLVTLEKNLQNDIKASELSLRNEIKASELRIENRLASMDGRTATMAGEISLLKWMVGTSIGLSLAIMLKLFLH